VTKSLRYLVLSHGKNVFASDDWITATAWAEVAMDQTSSTLYVLDTQEHETWSRDDWQDINPGWNDHLGTP